MWIFPIAPEDLAHPKQCADCGKPIIWAKTGKGNHVAINPGFKVLETLEFGDDGYLHLISREAAHYVTCEERAEPQPALTRRGRRKKADVDL